MDWRALLFSFGGRINRAKYWLAILINFVIWVICFGVVASVVNGLRIGIYGGAAGGIIALIGLMAIIMIGSFWSSLALAFKRLHDRNKSGVWLLLFWLAPSLLNAIGQSIGATGAGAFVALAGAAIAIWGFVEIACLKGTTGPNDYGPDPIPA